MASKISEIIAHELGIPLQQVSGTVGLLDDGATIPFISRYRKEATGGLSDEAIQSVDQRLRYYRELEKRRATILKSIEAQDKLTPELAARINGCWDATVLEDIYLIYIVHVNNKATAYSHEHLTFLAQLRCQHVFHLTKVHANCAPQLIHHYNIGIITA